METLTVLLLLTVLSSGFTEDVYYGAGDTLELRPDFSGEITSITWKHNNNLVAEWIKGISDLEYYDVFKGRATVDTTTGVLEITNMNSAYSGVYTVEINNIVQPVSYNIMLSSGSTEEKYFGDGGTLGLSPTVYEQITSITWKHNNNLVAEWEEGRVDLVYYDVFKGRATLNTTTGVLKITSMSSAYSGVYTVEINNIVQPVSYNVLSSGSTEEKYFGDGGTLGLNPTVSAQITSITWKHNNNLVAEWEEGRVDLVYYNFFKGRATLNTTTGVLEITSMSSADSGVYTVEINFMVQPERYDVKMIKEVTQPTVTLQPLCTSTHERCKLLCAGDTEGAEPVSYSWKMGDGEWEDGERSRSINNDKETQSIKTFSCRMKNPISEKESDIIPNVFFRSGLTEEKVFRDGGTLELRPHFSGEITSITWKHNNNLAAEWEEGRYDLVYYNVFKGRATLDTTTGVLEITNMNSAYSGVYTVEINNRVQPERYDVKLMEEVVQPAVMSPDQ